MNESINYERRDRPFNFSSHPFTRIFPKCSEIKLFRLLLVFLNIDDDFTERFEKGYLTADVLQEKRTKPIITRCLLTSNVPQIDVCIVLDRPTSPSPINTEKLAHVKLHQHA